MLAYKQITEKGVFWGKGGANQNEDIFLTYQ